MAGESSDLLIFDSRLLWQTEPINLQLHKSFDLVASSGWIYLLIVGRIRDSNTSAAGQRSEIGRYDIPMEVSLPGSGIGMINEDFHIARI